MSMDLMIRILTLVTLMVTSVTGLVVAFRVNVVHKIVNQAHTDLMNYQRALIRALEDKGVEVPRDQSIPPVGDPDR
jgi:hypothetical protein